MTLHIKFQWLLHTVFPLISAGPQINTAPLISTALLNTALIRIVAKLYQKLNQNAYGTNILENNENFVDI